MILNRYFFAIAQNSITTYYILTECADILSINFYDMEEAMKLLITCTGRRVELVERLSECFDIVAVDASDRCAISTYIGQLEDSKNIIFRTVPSCRDDRYIDAMVSLCQSEKVDFLVPLYEPEFLILCANRHRFEEIGTRLVLSDTEVIRICNDKLLMQEFFEANDIRTPKLKDSAPAIVKPVNGMGSSGIFKVDTDEELAAAKVLSKGPVIVQELVGGTEYTIDVLCDFDGNVVLAIPRIRVEVRDGEVSKSRVVKNDKIIAATKELVSKLNRQGKVVGPLTIQCFVNDEDEIIFIEVNPRFGGGVPLSLEASDYVNLFSRVALGEVIEETVTDFKEVSTYRFIKGLYRYE